MWKQQLTSQNVRKQVVKLTPFLLSEFSHQNETIMRSHAVQEYKN